MKVCIPTTENGGIDDFVGQHFGRVQTYTVVDLDANEVEAIFEYQRTQRRCWSAARVHIENGNIYTPLTDKRYLWKWREPKPRLMRRRCMMSNTSLSGTMICNLNA